jgi:hypothetical protein
MSASVLIENDTIGSINVVANGLPITGKNRIFYSSFNNRGLD